MIMCILSGVKLDEIPEIIVCRLRLRKVAVGLLLDRMNQIRKLDRVLDKEDRDIVTDDVPVTLPRVELDGETADIPRKIRRALVAGDRRKSDERRGLFASALEQVRLGNISIMTCSFRSSRAPR